MLSFSWNLIFSKNKGILLQSFKIKGIYSFCPISHVIKVNLFKNLSQFFFNSEKVCRSITSLSKRSNSWSLSSNCLCPKAPGIVRCVWYNPSPRPDCSSSRSRSLSLHLLCLLSRQVDSREDPTNPLSAWPPECSSDIFPRVGLSRTTTLLEFPTDDANCVRQKRDWWATPRLGSQSIWKVGFFYL